jgi:hypothetical protein
VAANSVWDHPLQYAIELAYIGKAIGQTNKRLSALLKHINP